MTNDIYQPNLFEDLDDTYREYQIGLAMDEIKTRFGKNAINRASSEFRIIDDQETKRDDWRSPCLIISTEAS